MLPLIRDLSSELLLQTSPNVIHPEENVINEAGGGAEKQVLDVMLQGKLKVLINNRFEQ